MSRRTILVSIILLLLIFSPLIVAATTIGPVFFDVCDKPYYYQRAVGSGVSMQPLMVTGDAVIIMKCDHPEFDPQVGDVVCYYSPKLDVYVSHRIINVMFRGDKSYYTCKGDNLAEPDTCLVPQDCLLGEIVAVIDHHNYFAMAVTKWILG